ncbi:hypothetical protein NPIL_150481 [Nephila pilipes]|uniref:Uncharacterized protein n=1 Tax=Nephila pilipes TaxID=299642 RepID=A0A8X6MZ78_NEPPI|nr:hypothetical protein NPIL_150481 [Nephila pilipes]
MLWKTSSDFTERNEEYEAIKENFKERDLHKKYENLEPWRYFGGTRNNFQNRGASGREVRNVNQAYITRNPMITSSRNYNQKSLYYDCGYPDHLSRTFPRRGQ